MADYVVTTANVIPSRSGEKRQGFAGETIAPGTPAVFLDSDQKWYKADADNETRAAATGLALNGAALNQPITIAITDDSLTPGFELGVGDVVIVSDTAGGLKPYADAKEGDYVTIVMIGIGGNKAKLVFASAGAPKPAEET